MVNPRIPAPVVAAGVALLVGGCSVATADYSDAIGNENPVPVAQVPEGPPEEVPDDSAVPDPVASWSCNYDVTHNDDWHDDVVCTNGQDALRPYLRDWDDFVTEAELMESAREFEDELNVG